MLNILYEDYDILVVKKPAGIESQTSRGFEADMVSEIKNYLNKFYTDKEEPYVGVIHRLDKPVCGIMVYAKTKMAANHLSKQVQGSSIRKIYQAVVCGKPVDNVYNYVDYLLKNGKTNYTHIVDKSVDGAKKAELSYRVLETREEAGGVLTLVEIQLMTGRHHQIRVQFASHGTPLWGDNKYNPEFAAEKGARPNRRGSLALCSCGLEFVHPKTGKMMAFSMEPEGEAFRKFMVL